MLPKFSSLPWILRQAGLNFCLIHVRCIRDTVYLSFVLIKKTWESEKSGSSRGRTLFAYQVILIINICVKDVGIFLALGKGYDTQILRVWLVSFSILDLISGFVQLRCCYIRDPIDILPIHFEPIKKRGKNKSYLSIKHNSSPSQHCNSLLQCVSFTLPVENDLHCNIDWDLMMVELGEPTC